MSDKKYAPVEGARTGGLTFIRPSKLAEEGVTGVVAEGIYEGTVPNSLEPSREDFKLKTNNGTVILNSTSSLARQMKSVQAGEAVRISYLGKDIIKSGKAKGKSTHNFLVEREVIES